MRAACRSASGPTCSPPPNSLYGGHELDVLAQVLRDAEPEPVVTVAETIRLRMGRPWRRAGYPAHLAFLDACYAVLRGHLESGLLQGVRRRDKHDGNRILC